MAEKLLTGFQNFKRENYGPDGLMTQLVQDGQDPEYFIISCIDSRSNPGTIFQTPPGIFFAHKAMGAIVRPYKKGTALAAALQFALHHNNVKKIVLLGHTGCGAIKALVDEIPDEEIFSFVEVAQAGLTKAKVKCDPDSDYENLLRTAEKEIVLQSAENLKTYPSVKDALAKGDTKILPWLFDMETGTIMEFNSKTNEFETIASGNTQKCAC